MEFKPDGRIEIDAVAPFGGGVGKLFGTLSDCSPTSEMELTITGSDVTIDDDLRRAFDAIKPAAEAIRKVHAIGKGKGVVTLKRRQGSRTVRVDADVDIDLRQFHARLVSLSHRSRHGENRRSPRSRRVSELPRQDHRRRHGADEPAGATATAPSLTKGNQPAQPPSARIPCRPPRPLTPPFEMRFLPIGTRCGITFDRRELYRSPRLSISLRVSSRLRRFASMRLKRPSRRRRFRIACTTLKAPSTRRTATVAWKGLVARHGDVEWHCARGYVRVDRGGGKLHFDALSIPELPIDADLKAAVPPTVRSVLDFLSPNVPAKHSSASSDFTVNWTGDRARRRTSRSVKERRHLAKPISPLPSALRKVAFPSPTSNFGVEPSSFHFTIKSLRLTSCAGTFGDRNSRTD